MMNSGENGNAVYVSVAEGANAQNSQAKVPDFDETPKKSCFIKHGAEGAIPRLSAGSYIGNSGEESFRL
jgi:hypothetical protein